MNKKVKIGIFVGVSAALLATIIAVICVFALHETAVRLTMNGERDMTLDVFSTYTEPGAYAGYTNRLGHEKEIPVTVDGAVNTQIVGVYTITYTAEHRGKTDQDSRTVTVVDTVAPWIDANSYSVEVPIEKAPASPEDVPVIFTAMDNYDGDLTAQVIKTIEDNICRLTVSDSSGNTATAEIYINYHDGIKPVIQLAGQATMYLQAGSTYEEPGYAATDNLDGDLTASVTVSGRPNMDCTGNYIITYTVTDAAGNTSYATRKVVVYGANGGNDYQTVVPNGKTIYLTFDDGPGKYTAELLDILARYHVQATFFVTNQFPGYQSLIAREYREGHAVGVHTLTHKWDIYDSVDAYLADFNAMHDIILQQTGYDTKLFRFPGGTNNAVSKKHSIGIMTTLNELMSANGYVEFDWNVDCGDTSTSNASTVANNVINGIARHDHSVVLMHDIKQHTVNAIPAIIEYGLSHGYTFATLDTSSPRVQSKPTN